MTRSRTMSGLTARHEDLRPLLFSVAYRMLGSVTEAEDVVQEAFLRLHRTDLDAVRSVDAFAVTVVTRLSIDTLRSARSRREQYVGTWLPEPLVEGPDADPVLRVEADEILSIAFLALLERLSPAERAVFVLREVFDHEYAEIASVLERSEAACRQLLRRARAAVAAGTPRFDPDPARRSALAAAFLAALREGEVDALEQLLADDVVFSGDGGGKAPAIRAPLHGRAAVARFLLGLARQGARAGAVLQPVVVNGQPGVRIATRDGALLGVLSLEIADGRVRSLSNQINPDKLRHLGPVGDFAGLDRSVP